MSIDDLARTATSELARSATRGLDAEDMLVRLHGSRHRRSAARALALLLVLVVAAGGAVLSQRTEPSVPTKDGHGEPRFSLATCRIPHVTCLGDRRLRIRLRQPLTFTVPSSFAMSTLQVVPSGIEINRQDVDRTGVTVLQDAVPVRYDASWARDRAAGDTAASMAQWLADRPYLRHTEVTSRTVAGRTVWRVTGDLRPGAELPGLRPRSFPEAPAFASGDTRAGYAPDLLGSFTLVDQAGGGVTAIWSWNDSADSTALPGNEVMVDALLAG